MNHLAHTALAGPEALDRVGSLLGDFWRGALDPAWPPQLAAGVRLHRRVDAWTDSDAALAETRALFDAPYRRYAGILLDVYFDHLLALDFERHVGVGLDQHVESVYAALRADDATWPAPFRLYASRLVSSDGLRAYRRPEYLGFVLGRISERLQRDNPLAQALPVLEALARPLARSFEQMFPRLLAFAVAEQGRSGG